MIGTPSLSFIRKIYNILSHKQEQLDEVLEFETKINEHFNGDFNLAYKNAQNGNWTILSKD